MVRSLVGIGSIPHVVLFAELAVFLAAVNIAVVVVEEPFSGFELLLPMQAWSETILAGFGSCSTVFFGCCCGLHFTVPLVWWGVFVVLVYYTPVVNIDNGKWH